MRRKRRRDCNRGSIEGKRLRVALMALSAVRKGVRRAIRFGAGMRAAAAIEDLGCSVLLGSQPHQACARGRHGAVREEHRREKD